MLTRNFVYLLLFIALTTACHSKQVSSNEFTAYINDPSNGLTKITEIDDVKISVTYQPTASLIARELDSNSNKFQLDSLQRKYNPYHYFTLSLYRNNRAILDSKDGQSGYSSLLETLAFGMDTYVYMIAPKGDTIRPSTYLLDRSYNLQPSTNILFVFPKSSTSSALHFNVNEFGLGIGNLKFDFDAVDIEKAPAMDYSR